MASVTVTTEDFWGVLFPPHPETGDQVIGSNVIGPQVGGRGLVSQVGRGLSVPFIIQVFPASFAAVIVLSQNLLSTIILLSFACRAICNAWASIDPSGFTTSFRLLI